MRIRFEDLLEDNFVIAVDKLGHTLYQIGLDGVTTRRSAGQVVPLLPKYSARRLNPYALAMAADQRSLFWADRADGSIMKISLMSPHSGLGLRSPSSEVVYRVPRSGLE